MDEFEIECDECGVESLIHSYDPPTFCPLCGADIIPSKIENVDEEDWYEDD